MKSGDGTPHTIVVVPCYNEVQRLDRRRYVQFVRQCADVDILFVNDGSTDGTSKFLHEMSASHPQRLSVHDMSENGGKAEAVRQGLLQACHRRPKYVGFWDADLATPLEAIPQFIEMLEVRPLIHMVAGSRIALLGRQVQRKFLRRLIGRAFASVVSAMLGVAVYDTQCGAKLFRFSREVEAIFQKPFCSRWIFDVEIFARLLRQSQNSKLPPIDQTVFEFPLEQWHDVAGSKLKLRDFFVAGFDLLKVYRTYLAGSRISKSPQLRPIDQPESSTATGQTDGDFEFTSSLQDHQKAA